MAWIRTTVRSKLKFENERTTIQLSWNSSTKIGTSNIDPTPSTKTSILDFSSGAQARARAKYRPLFSSVWARTSYSMSVAHSSVIFTGYFQGLYFREIHFFQMLKPLDNKSFHCYFCFLLWGRYIRARKNSGKDSRLIISWPRSWLSHL